MMYRCVMSEAIARACSVWISVAFCVSVSYGMAQRDDRDRSIGELQRPPLIEAAMRGKLDQVKKRLALGDDVNLRDEYGGTPLLSAAWAANTEIAMLLMKHGADVNAMDKNRNTALMGAAVDDNCELAAALLDAKARLDVENADGKNSLTMAAQANSRKVLALLAQHGAKLDARTSKGETALTVAAVCGQYLAVEALLDLGADINATSNGGQTPLIAAVDGRRADVVTVLLERGADTAARDSLGRTALDLAKEKQDKKIVALLKKPGSRKPRGKVDNTPEPDDESVRQWVVSRDTDGDFDNIRDAVKRAGTGDRIAVRPGVYRESIVLSKPLEIVGDGPRDKIVVHSTRADCIFIDADRTLIKGLTLRCRAGARTEVYALDIAKGKAVVEDCDLSSDSLCCVGVHGKGVLAVVRKCWIHDGNDAGVFFYEQAGGTVEDCDIFGNSEAGVAIQGGADPVIRNCRIHHNQAGGVSVTGGSRGTLEACHIFANAGEEVRSDKRSRPVIRECRIVDDVLSTDTVTSNIDDDDQAVDPDLEEVVLKFAQPMNTDGWHLARVKKKYGQFPELVGDKPAFFRDERTFVVRVRLKPSTKYAFGLNAPGHMDFLATDGRPLEETIYYFRTGEGTEGDAQKSEPTGFEVGMLVLKFLGNPTQKTFLAARSAVINSKDYKPYRRDLSDIAALIQQEEFEKARAKIIETMPSLYLSPRVHLYASTALEKLGAEEASKEEVENARKCLKAILASGDGTKERPYLALRITDEYDALTALEKKSSRQGLVRHEGRPHDVIHCTDGTEIWFDVSAFFGRH